MTTKRTTDTTHPTTTMPAETWTKLACCIACGMLSFLTESGYCLRCRAARAMRSGR